MRHAPRKRDSKITYVKPEELNKKSNIESNETHSPWSSIENTSYDLVKPFGQKNSKTASFYENRKPNADKTVEGIEKGAELIETILEHVPKK